MLGWREFAAEEPELAAAGRALLYQFGVGLAFLATTRRDGAPRRNPMCPLIDETGLSAFLVPGPKRDDLHRDGRYAMHSFPADDNEDAFSIAGSELNPHARLTVHEPVTGGARRRRRPPPAR